MASKNSVAGLLGRLRSRIGAALAHDEGAPPPVAAPECPECGSALLRPCDGPGLVCSWCERAWTEARP